MKRVLLLFVLLLDLSVLCQAEQVSINQENVFDYVNTFIGSGGEGYGIGSTPPGPQVPYGMVRLGPDTALYGDVFIPFNHFGGYYYGDDTINCFSHTHMDGSGVLDYGNIGIMPISSAPNFRTVFNYGFASLFDHQHESSAPGYYSVLLQTWNIQAELTTTRRVGVHRYTFPSTTSGYILFPISHALSPGACVASEITIDPSSGEVYGWIHNIGGYSGRFGGFKTYFVAQFNTTASFSSYGTWVVDQVNPGSVYANGTTNQIGAYVQINLQGNSAVEVYVGVSFVSVQNARLNLFKETNNRKLNFDLVLQQTQQLWLDHLLIAKVNASSTQEEDLIKFYSFLYHTAQGPTSFDDANGQYLGFDNQVHTLVSPQTHFYSDMSIWDVHRSEFPLITLTHSDVMADIMRSLVLMFQQGGDLPRWPMANGYTSGMMGTHTNVLIADAYTKGIRNFDYNTAYKGMVQSATKPQVHAGRDDITDWINRGFIPYQNAGDAVCDTLAYSYDDWAVGNMALMLGYTSEAGIFHSRSNNYKNVWNSDVQFFCPKNNDSTWSCPAWYQYIDPFDSKYVEGDAWQYRWFVVHDPLGLVSLFSSPSYFIEQLSILFERSEWDPYNILPNPYYWAGNEPSLFAGWLFDFAGRPDLTQKYIRMVMDTRYLVSDDGLPGNDDYGTMSAWFVFAAMGFYPQSGGPIYCMGSPIFPELTFHRAIENQTLVIKTTNGGSQNVYVQSVTLNGNSYRVPLFNHPGLFTNNTVNVLEFVMGSNPPSLSYWDNDLLPAMLEKNKWSIDV